MLWEQSKSSNDIVYHCFVTLILYICVSHDLCNNIDVHAFQRVYGSRISVQRRNLNPVWHIQLRCTNHGDHNWTEELFAWQRHVWKGLCRSGKGHIYITSAFEDRNIFLDAYFSFVCIISLRLIILILQVRQTWTDEHIASKYSSLDADSLQQVKTCIETGLKCVDIDQKKRPSIVEIVDKLDGRHARWMVN